MRDLDETDLDILSMLTEDARRSYSSIGEAVGLSGPAVSDRVTRLRETGVIDRFTVDVNREAVEAGVPVFVRVDPGRDGTEAVRDRVAAEEAVEHLFVTADGGVWFAGRTDARDARGWVESLLSDAPDADYTVTLLDEVAWSPTFDGTGFALSCAECGNTVDAEGESVRLGDDAYHFCCSSCRSRFEERYRELESGA
ncbi:AsnC family transcriptional regulator [Halosegnis marinus]|uniref:AsnC family transcriptional regulator n=1 Tax=Halosegnis marinus TaxID=3034023 RepID=A0ABD5ZKN2_9EURY|nr:AsnC family transcriptional regulator [Halosegnis sp. DT85]